MKPTFIRFFSSFGTNSPSTSANGTSLVNAQLSKEKEFQSGDTAEKAPANTALNPHDHTEHRAAFFRPPQRVVQRVSTHGTEGSAIYKHIKMSPIDNAGDSTHDNVAVSGRIKTQISHLLADLFSVGEVRKFVRYYFTSIESVLPIANVSLTTLCDAVVDTMDKKGLINANFFALLLTDRQGRSTDINRVCSAWQNEKKQPPSSEQNAGTKPSAVESQSTEYSPMSKIGVIDSKPVYFRDLVLALRDSFTNRKSLNIFLWKLSSQLLVGMPVQEEHWMGTIYPEPITGLALYTAAANLVDNNLALSIYPFLSPSSDVNKPTNKTAQPKTEMPTDFLNKFVSALSKCFSQRRELELVIITTNISEAERENLQMSLPGGTTNFYFLTFAFASMVIERNLVSEICASALAHSKDNNEFRQLKEIWGETFSIQLDVKTYSRPMSQHDIYSAVLNDIVRPLYSSGNDLKVALSRDSYLHDRILPNINFNNDIAHVSYKVVQNVGSHGVYPDLLKSILNDRPRAKDRIEALLNAIDNKPVNPVKPENNAANLYLEKLDDLEREGQKIALSKEGGYHFSFQWKIENGMINFGIAGSSYNLPRVEIELDGRRYDMRGGLPLESYPPKGSFNRTIPLNEIFGESSKKSSFKLSILYDGEVPTEYKGEIDLSDI